MHNKPINNCFSIIKIFLQLLWERFKEFARETQAVGSERVATAERIADQMIAMGHSDNATIAQWKEGLKETWQDLLELIETRTQVREQNLMAKIEKMRTVRTLD